MKQFRFACAILLPTLAVAVSSGCSASPQATKGTVSNTTITNPPKGATPSPSPSPLASPSPSSAPGALVGSINFSQQTGEINGYASENGNAGAVVSVEIYINGPIGTGTLLSTVPANQVLIAGGDANGFMYLPSSTYLDSTPRKLYAYMTTSGNPNPTLIGGAGIDYFAGPDAKGLAYYNTNLQSTLSTQCASCHATEWGNYYTARAELGDPTSLSGGTATNNTFYKYASGVNHPGGDQCAGNNLCSLIETWWGMDFGK